MNVAMNYTRKTLDSEDNDHTGCLNGQSLSATDLYRTWLTVQCINFDLTYING